jgi:preprotein translocase subunit SecF
MKKLISSFAFLAILFFTSYSQNNKPDANSFGLQYGVVFSSAVCQAISFTGWLKNGIEVRGGLPFSVSVTNSTQDNSYPGYTSTSVNKYGTFSFTPALSVVKHFPLKSKLDFFIGGSANVGFSLPTRDQYSSNTNSYTNYYSFQSTDTKNPITLSFGAGVVGGANFFFYKNLALGADVSIGFSANTPIGKRTLTQTDIESGSANSNPGNNVTTNSYSASGLSYSIGFTGYGGLHLIYYLKVNKHKKPAEQKT